MELVTRYLYALTRCLPERIRADVEKEVRASISDMLPDNPTDDQVRAVLMELGDPVALARRYDESPRYLIGPGLFETYLRTLKLVAGLAASIAPFVVLLLLILDAGSGGSPATWIGKLVSAAVQGAVGACIWVTLVFAIIERAAPSGVSLAHGRGPWTPERLPAVPVLPGRRISRVESGVGIAWTVFCAAVLLFAPAILSVRLGAVTAGQWLPVFDLEQLHLLAPAIVAAALVALGVGCLKLVTARWTTTVAAANLVSNIATSAMFLLFALDAAVWSRPFLDAVGKAVHANLADAGGPWARIRVLTAVTCRPSARWTRSWDS